MARPNAKAKLGVAELAWLAGFFDGEGSIMIFESHSKQGRRKPYWEPAVSVCNTDPTAILEIQSWFGGSLHVPRRRDGHKAVYQLKWYAAKAETVLLAIRPFLRMKGRQADIVLEFIRHKRETPVPGQKGHPANVVDFRQRLVTEIQGLNARGVASG